MSLRSIAEGAAQGRCRGIVDRIEAAVAEHAPHARVERTVDGITVWGRGLKARWLSEAGLRFARRTRA